MDGSNVDGRKEDTPSMVPQSYLAPQVWAAEMAMTFGGREYEQQRLARQKEDTPSTESTDDDAVQGTRARPHASPSAVPANAPKTAAVVDVSAAGQPCRTSPLRRGPSRRACASRELSNCWRVCLPPAASVADVDPRCLLQERGGAMMSGRFENGPKEAFLREVAVRATPPVVVGWEAAAAAGCGWCAARARRRCATLRLPVACA